MQQDGEEGGHEAATASLPSQQDIELATAARRALAEASASPMRVKLPEGAEFVLPSMVANQLPQILDELIQGNAVAIMPLHTELSTQEAADYLNVSRPFFVRLLQENRLPHHMVGTHRRVRFNDLRAYKSVAKKHSTEG